MNPLNNIISHFSTSVYRREKRLYLSRNRRHASHSIISPTSTLLRSFTEAAKGQALAENQNNRLVSAQISDGGDRGRRVIRISAKRRVNLERIHDSVGIRRSEMWNRRRLKGCAWLLLPLHGKSVVRERLISTSTYLSQTVRFHSRRRKAGQQGTRRAEDEIFTFHGFTLQRPRF